MAEEKKTFQVPRVKLGSQGLELISKIFGGGSGSDSESIRQKISDRGGLWGG